MDQSKSAITEVPGCSGCKRTGNRIVPNPEIDGSLLQVSVKKIKHSSFDLVMNLFVQILASDGKGNQRDVLSAGSSFLVVCKWRNGAENPSSRTNDTSHADGEVHVEGVNSAVKGSPCAGEQKNVHPGQRFLNEVEHRSGISAILSMACDTPNKVGVCPCQFAKLKANESG